MTFIKHSAIAILFTCISLRGEGRAPEWFQERMSEIETSDKQPIDQQFRILGRLVAIGKDQKNPDFDEERKEVFLASQSKLLKIPGHSKWFADEIKRMTDLEIHGAFHHERG